MGTRGDTWREDRPGAPASLDTEEVVRTPASPPSSYTQPAHRGAFVLGLVAVVTGLSMLEGVKIGKRQKNKNFKHAALSLDHKGAEALLARCTSPHCN